MKRNILWIAAETRVLEELFTKNQHNQQYQTHAENLKRRINDLVCNGEVRTEGILVADLLRKLEKISPS
jgi:hypothetical protein